jgi:GTP-binding protein Era
MNSGYVSIIGRPNVGKSTLINTFIGEKIAAVSPKPQTTRNRILGIHTDGKGQIVFIDTPGIHKPYNKMHSRMVDIAISSTQGIDLIVLVVDASQEFGKGDEFVLDQLSRANTPIMLVINKIDLIKKPQLLPLIDKYNKLREFKAIVPISALKEEGMDLLRGELFNNLPESEYLYPEDLISDQPERTFVAEIIREKVFLNTSKEIPFCTAVLIDAFEEEGHMINISASIILERQTQKGIVIGRAGSMLKKIGTEARLELEKILDTRIYLDLHVKVKNNWREDERMLRELGIE